MNMDDSTIFFANRSCKYYPCHDCPDDINCLFCFCPLYHTDCGGNYTMIEKDGNRIKSCKDCIFPHIAENYSEVIRLLKKS